jgi:hypothetical protein
VGGAALAAGADRAAADDDGTGRAAARERGPLPVVVLRVATFEFIDQAGVAGVSACVILIDVVTFAMDCRMTHPLIS